MTVSQQTTLINIFQQMIDAKEHQIQKLKEFKAIGVEIGAPTVDDIIAQELVAISNLQNAISLMRSHS